MCPSRENGPLKLDLRAAAPWIYSAALAALPAPEPPAPRRRCGVRVCVVVRPFYCFTRGEYTWEPLLPLVHALNAFTKLRRFSVHLLRSVAAFRIADDGCLRRR